MLQRSIWDISGYLISKLEIEVTRKRERAGEWVKMLVCITDDDRKNGDSGYFHQVGNYL